MTKTESIAQTIATYQKHGWVLRRLLLRPETRHALTALSGGVPISEFELDAAWFSRPPNGGPIAWEIRYLGDTPFALVETINESDPDFERNLHSLELNLAQSVTAKRSQSQ